MVERLVANEKVEGSTPLPAPGENYEWFSRQKMYSMWGGIPAFDIKEIHKYLKKVDGWDVKEDETKLFFNKKI